MNPSRIVQGEGPRLRAALVRSLVLIQVFFAGLTGAAVVAGGGAQAAWAAGPPEHFARCYPPKPGGDDILDDIAAPDFVAEFGGTLEAARRWLDVQSVATQIPDVMRANAAARDDYMNFAFYNRHKRVEVDVRNHSHDAAIHYCARQAGIDKYVRIKIHRFASRDFFHALRRIEDQLADYYAAGLFECSYGAADFYDIEVYAPATDAQYKRIKHAAEAQHVAFHIKRLSTPRPELDTGDESTDAAPPATTPQATTPPPPSS